MKTLLIPRDLLTHPAGEIFHSFSKISQHLQKGSVQICADIFFSTIMSLKSSVF